MNTNLTSQASADMVDYHGFAISSEKHPAGGAKGFSNGIFYGTVDGRSCTAPVWSKEGAIEHAKLQLDRGGLKAALLTTIEIMNQWISEGTRIEEARETIRHESALLRKVEEYLNHRATEAQEQR